MREIATYISEALARYGVAGDVYIQEGYLVVLQGAGPRVTTEIGSLAQHWELLPGDERQRRTGELARRLVDARRMSAPPPTKEAANWGWLVWFAGVSVLILAGVAAFRVVAPKVAKMLSAEPAAASTVAPPTTSDLDEARSSRVCEAAASRALRGSTLGQADSEGWQVDIAVLRPGQEPSPVDDPALAGFIRGPSDLRRLVWPGAKTLSAVEAAGARVELEDLALPPTLKPRFRGIVLTFSGRFATPYFNEASRSEYMQLGHALSDELKADFAGVFAHCVGSKEKLAGSWFRAQSPALGAAALIYFMGVNASLPHVRQELLNPSGGMLDYSFALENIRSSTRALSYEQVRTLIGTYGGSISGPPQGPTTLLFDFKDSSRAARASRQLARTAGLDDGR